MTTIDSTSPNGIARNEDQALTATFSSDAAYLTHRDFLKRLGNPLHTTCWAATSLGEYLNDAMSKRGLSARDFWIFPGSPLKQESIAISSGFIVEEFEPTPTAADLARLDRLLDLTAADVANYRMVTRAGWLDETIDRPLWSVTATETLARLVATTHFTLSDLWQWSASRDEDGYWNRQGVLNDQPRSIDGADSVIPTSTQLSCAGSGMRLYHREPHYVLAEDDNTEIMFWNPSSIEFPAETLNGLRLDQVVDCSSGILALLADRAIRSWKVCDLALTLILDVPVVTLAPIPQEHLLEIGLHIEPADAARPWWLMTPAEKLQDGWEAALSSLHLAA